MHRAMADAAISLVITIEAWSLVTHPGEQACPAGVLIPA